jgi:hypothetical protein
MFINNWLSIIGMIGGTIAVTLAFGLPKRIKTGKWE